MAQTNVTKDENQKTFTELFYSAEFVRGVDGDLIFFSALNILLGTLRSDDGDGNGSATKAIRLRECLCKSGPVDFA